MKNRRLRLLSKLGGALIDVERSGYCVYSLNWTGGDGDLYGFE